MGFTGLWLPCRGVERGEVGERGPGGEIDLSEMMLIFQTGGEQTGVPGCDGSWWLYSA